jgi:YidB-like protein
VNISGKRAASCSYRSQASPRIGRLGGSGTGKTANRNTGSCRWHFGRRSGQDVLETLVQQTGLSQEELLARLSRELPTAVDKYTPDGRLPPRDV